MSDTESEPVYVIKRDGRREEVSFDKVSRRIKTMSKGLKVSPFVIAQKVCNRIYPDVKTSELDELAAKLCASMASDKLDYGTLASRIIISNNHKNTSPSFSEAMEVLWNNTDTLGKRSPLINESVYGMVQKHKMKLNSVIDSNNDYLFDYFAYKTLERAYLCKVKGTTVERIQYMFMRVSLGLYPGDLKNALRSYELLRQKLFTHATPTLYHAGTPHQQMISCFLLGSQDSVTGIYKTITDCAQISKWAGGIGVHISNIRGSGSYIRGTNGTSNGIVPMLKVYNDTAQYIDQGGGKRKGSFAMYLEPHHPDIMAFLELRLNHGDESARARDLFTAVWLSDHFMECVRDDLDWHLFDPDECKDLNDLYGVDYTKRCKEYVEMGRVVKTIKAQVVWKAMVKSQIETGTPYTLFKCNVNRKSNQKNIGTVRSSNLCVAPDTKILTDKGYVEIHTVADHYVNVWNGEKFSRSWVTKTGSDQKLLKIKFDNGSILECTTYHKFYLEGVRNAVTADALKSGDQLISIKIPKVEQYELKKHLEVYPPIEVTETKYRIVENDKFEEIKVESVVDEGRVSDTYCFNEPERHLGIFNGVPAGNCSEIVEYSDDKEYACCCLCSICLPRYVFTDNDGNPYFDHNLLVEVTAQTTRNLNQVVDLNYYPIPETRRSNMRHRPLGHGVQGLADTYILMRYPYESDEATQLNKEIFESLYYGTVKASADLAKERYEEMQVLNTLYKEGHLTCMDDYKVIDHTGDPNIKKLLEQLKPNRWELEMDSHFGSYSSFVGSPIHKGEFQFDMWGVTPSDRYDWEALRKQIGEFGVRNSLLVALMPTASTSQIMGNNEAFEPYTSNAYVRSTNAGVFKVLNKHMIRDLMSEGIWNSKTKEHIIAQEGSIQKLDGVSDEIKALYKTVWEIPQETIVKQAADRGAFVCQTQSMNFHWYEPSMKLISSALFDGWRRGLKTGSYYIRGQPKASAQKFTIDPKLLKRSIVKKSTGESNDAICESCSG